MAQPGSVSAWIEELTRGNRNAAEHLWQRYFQQMVRLAYRRLRSMPRRDADEEDVALSAFASFCKGAENGRFSRLRDRNNLWPLLIVITKRKAIALQRRHARVRGESAFVGGQGSDPSQFGIQQVVDRGEPTPEFAALTTDEYRRLLALLGEPKLQQIATWKMEGYTNKEIAAKLDCGLRSIERKLRIIRDIWEQEIADE